MASVNYIKVDVSRFRQRLQERSVVSVLMSDDFWWRHKYSFCSWYTQTHTHKKTTIATHEYWDTHIQKDHSHPVIQNSQGRLSYYSPWLFICFYGLPHGPLDSDGFVCVCVCLCSNSHSNTWSHGNSTQQLGCSWLSISCHSWSGRLWILCTLRLR